MKEFLPTEALRYDMSQFYPLKAVLEELLGHRVYSRLKETATLRDWKEAIQKLLRAIKKAIQSTVDIADDDWFAEIDSILELGKTQTAKSKTATELFASLSATLSRPANFRQRTQTLVQGNLENRCQRVESIRDSRR
jgi:hypothetical protein